MALVVFTTILLAGWGFVLCVLVQWLGGDHHTQEAPTGRLPSLCNEAMNAVRNSKTPCAAGANGWHIKASLGH